MHVQTIRRQVGLSNFSYLDGESAMEAYVVSTGPVTVFVSIKDWTAYVSGILTNAECDLDANHYVQVVGINRAEHYWIVRAALSYKCTILLS